MKILMTSDTFLPLLGGAEIHVKNLIERLSEPGHHVSLITCQDGQDDFDKAFSVTRIPWSKKNIFRSFKEIWKQSKNVDVIHSHYCYRLALIAGIVGRIRKIPVIVSLHGLGILDEAGAKGIYKLAHSTYRYWSLKFSTHVISTSQDLADVAYKYISPSKISIILNGYDEKVFKYDNVIPKNLSEKYSGKKIILTVRRIVPKNGIHFLIEAMPYIIKEIPEIHYIAIGDGRMREYVESRIKDLKIENHVTLVGRLDNSFVPGYLKLADVVVFPSTAESSSIACSEAMAVGKTIVASAVGGLVELLGKNGEYGTLVKLVDWTGSNYDAPLSLSTYRYQALSDAVVKSIRGRNKENEMRIAKHAQETVSWDVIVKKTFDIYNRESNK